MHRLMNSAVMPQEGTYELMQLHEAGFVNFVQSAAQSGELKSYIGYKQTAQHIKRITGVTVEVNRGVFDLEEGDILLICKLRYRVKDPSHKGKPVNEDDFEYFICYYEEA